MRKKTRRLSRAKKNKVKEALREKKRRQKEKKKILREDTQIRERYEWIRCYNQLVQQGERHPVKKVCERFGIDRKTFKRWHNRYEDSGRDVKLLADRSRRPQTIHYQVPELIEMLILIVRMLKGWGAERLAAEFKHRGIYKLSHQGVHNIYVRHGVNNIKKLGRKKRKRYERVRKNELWHIDIKGPFYIIGVGKVYTIGIIDDYSRYIIKCELRTDQEMKTVMDILKDGMEICGKPEEMINDNGLQFVALREGSLNGFQKLLKKKGIKQLRCRIHSPESNGKIERYWKTLEDECLGVNYFTSLEEAQKKVDEWVEYYNHHRLSKALGWKTPAERYLGIVNQDKGFTGIPGLGGLNSLWSETGKHEKAIKDVETSVEYGEVALAVREVRRAA